MREIVIKSVEDLEKLKSISKKEYIVLRIGKEFHHVTFPAISLEGFQGTIDVWFEDSKQKYSFTVVTDEVKRMQFCFTSILNARVFVSPNVSCSIKYKLENKTMEVSNYHEFLKALQTNSDILLKNDIVLPDGIIFPKRKIKIDGEGHYIYANRGVIHSLKYTKKYFQTIDLSFFVVDQVIQVSDIADFYQVLDYPNDKVVLSLENTIENQEMVPISLKDFYGTAIILGNGNSLCNIKLLDNSSTSIGFISDLSYSANLICSDLTFQKIHFPETPKENVGCVLGARNGTNGLYAGPAGKTIFTNCDVKMTLLLKGSCHTGVFAGCVDDNAECFGCNSSYILGSPAHIYFGNQVYCDSDNLVVASNHVGEKRISFQGVGKKRRKE